MWDMFGEWADQEYFAKYVKYCKHDVGGHYLTWKAHYLPVAEMSAEWTEYDDAVA